MKIRQCKNFFIILSFIILIFTITGCRSRTKDTSDDLQDPTEVAVINDKERVTPEVTPKITPEVSPTPMADQSLDKTETITPPVVGLKSIKIEMIAEGKLSLRHAKLEYSIIPRMNESTDFNRFYYMDNKNLLNTFFWEYNTDSHLKYTSCRLYKEQQDGSVKGIDITWDSETNKIINLTHEDNGWFSIMSQWMDEKSGDFYIIVNQFTHDADDNPNYLYGIHPNGKLFVSIKLEDYLVMDKIDPSTFTCGCTINYLGQENGISYFDYQDDSQKAVVYYDMNNKCFTKQIFTGYEVKGMIDGKYVGVSEKQLFLGSIPKGERQKNAKGNSIIIGKSEIKHRYHLPKNRGISVNGKYVYMLTDQQYQRFVPGDNRWEMLGDVSQITEIIKGDLYLEEFIAKNKNIFSLHLYADCAEGDYIDVYHIE